MKCLLFLVVRHFPPIGNHALVVAKLQNIVKKIILYSLLRNFCLKIEKVRNILKKQYFLNKMELLKVTQTQGAFPVARSKKEDIPLAENDVKRNFRPMACLLVFLSLTFADFGILLKLR